MKKVFTAEKDSYGTGFFRECSTLQELKHAILYHYYSFTDCEYSEELFTEELFNKAIEEDRYTLYEVNLHDEEEIEFKEYDGQSRFSIVKKEPNILSTTKLIE